MDNQNSTVAPQQPSEKGGSNTMVMGIFSYLGILIVIPFLSSKNQPFVKFHIKQGLVLLAIELILWAVSGMVWELRPIIGILELAVFVLAIIGIVNVVQNKEKELPFVGSFSKYINI